MGRHWPLADMGCCAPGAGNEAKWLTAPKTAFNLLLRMYAPESEALPGTWNPPPVTRIQSTTGIGAQ